MRSMTTAPATTASPPAPRVYSYLRFSTPEQALGDSRRRQVEAAAAWAAARGLTLDDELRDEGVSGYRGANLSAESALGSFLRAVEAGLVAEGSVLVVESLDRLSRDRLLNAQRLLISLLINGVTVVTLADGREYSQESVNNNPMDLIASLLVFMRANEESDMKARRLRAAWDNKREKAKRGSRMTSSGPAWLRAAGDGWEVIEERAAVVRRVFQDTLSGVSQTALAKTLTAEGVGPWEGGRVWHRTYIRKLLDNPAVVGTLVPHITERTDGGGRVRRPLQPVEGYFPAVIDAETWHRARSLLGSRDRPAAPRGRHAGQPVRSLLARLAKCPICGDTMTRVTKGPNGGRARLVCALAKAGGDCVYHSVHQDDVEGAIFEKWSALIEAAPPATAGEAEALAEVRRLETERSLVEDELTDLEERRRSLTKAERATRAGLFTQLAILAEELEAAQHRLADAGSAIVYARLEKLAAALEGGPSEDLSEANRALMEAVEAVVVDYRDGQLLFHWRHGGTSTVTYRYDWG